MLTCQELTELVSAHIEGRLDLADAFQFHVHRAMCGDCREYVRQAALTRESLAGLRDLPMDPTSVESFVRLFEQARAAR